MRRLALLAFSLCLAGVVGAQESAEQPAFRLSPALLKVEDDYTGAARVELLLGDRRHDVSRAFPSSRYWRIEGKGAVAIDPDLNPDPLVLDVAGGLAISIAKPRRITFNPDDVDAPGSAMEFDYGDVSIGAQAHIETNQRRTEARAAFSGELIYTHDHQRAVWPFIPSVYALVGAARTLASEMRDSLSLPDDESFLRLEAGAAWHLSADRGWMPSAFRPVWLHAELALYREAGVDDLVETLGLNDGTRVAFGAAYRFMGEERGLVEEIFLRWTNGETPSLPAPRKAWALGVVLSP